MVYNPNIPQPGHNLSTSQGDLLGNFGAIDSALFGMTRNHVTMTDSTNGGLHKRVDFYQAVASPTISGFTASLYPQTVSGNSELFYKNATADIQLTNSALVASSGQGMMPGGLQFRCGSATAPSSSPVSSVTISYTPFPVATLVAFAIASGNGRIMNTTGLTPSEFNMNANTAFGNTDLFYWFAIGY